MIRPDIETGTRTRTGLNYILGRHEVARLLDENGLPSKEYLDWGMAVMEFFGKESYLQERIEERRDKVKINGRMIRREIAEVIYRS